MSTDANAPVSSTKTEDFANLQIPSFLALACRNTSQVVQVVTDGKQLTAENLRKPNGITLTKPILITDTPESIGMKVIKCKQRQVKVSDIADIIGGAHPVDVIDVEHQDELEGWTLGDLVDYFEDPYRQKAGHTNTTNSESTSSPPATSSSSSSSSIPKRRQRRAAAKTLEKKASQRPRVLNQISLEFSNTPLRQRISSPQFVQDLDWIDQAWPGRKCVKTQTRIYPRVQYYCLTSAAGCYTDFHVDFGGTSVWYHVLSGSKDFCLIMPTKANLQVFEDWNCNSNQATIFLPNLIEDKSTIIRITLKASQTMIIPSAWIHGVYTPTDSLVLGGNFLHGLDIQKQLEVYDIEERTRVKERFRFPLYKQLQFYAGGMYLHKMRQGNISPMEVDGCMHLYKTLQSWWEEDYMDEVPEIPPGQPSTVAAAALEVAQQNECTNVEHFLFEFKQEYTRVKEDGVCPNEKFKCTLSPPRPKLKLKLKANENTIVVQPEEPLSQPIVVPKVEPVTSREQQRSTSTEPKRIRLKLKTDTATQPSSQEPDPFQIVLSSNVTTTKIAPPKKATKTKRVREDTEWYDEGPVAEDEWIPSPAKKSSTKKKAAKGTSKTTPKGKQGASNARGKQRTEAPTTARSRLMKRFR
ncbi:MAG: hypothetical protein SGBAC_000528 [Bacillariaceae sp.]